MDAARAARTLEIALRDHGRDFTIADASSRSGLPLRDAESGLHALISEYRGHLRVTSEGELLFRFPAGFTKPWVTRTRLAALEDRLLRALVGIGRFVVRAWIMVVLVAYALLFLALVIGLTFARSSDSRSSRDDRGGVHFDLGYVLLRIVADALFWTFHPFSPFSYQMHGLRTAAATHRKKDEVPFYEKVNRFFFGPEVPAADPREMERRILSEIRAQKGRIGLADVIRVTGLPRDEADPLMSRLLLDYDGEVEVSDEGGIVYRFPELRKTVETAGPSARPQPVWERLKRLAPLTGNEPGSNLVIAALNGFNLVMSIYALSHGWTFAKIGLLLQGVPEGRIPFTGTPIALGVVPLVFSIALFLLPLARAAARPFKERRVARENGRRGMLREVLTHLGSGEVTDASLRAAWKAASGGREPDDKDLTREVVALGGDVDIDEESGKVRYRFPDFEAEATALQAEREAAAEEEARVGKVIFSSED